MVAKKKRRKSVIPVPKASPLKGRIIDQSKRTKSDPKLGRKFKYGKPSEKHVVTLSLEKGVMNDLLKKQKTESKSKAITSLILKAVKKKKKL